MNLNSVPARGKYRHGWTVLPALLAAWVLTPSARAQTAFGAFPNNSTHSNAWVMAAIANVPTNAGVVYDPIGQTNFIPIYNFGTNVFIGPVNVALTLARIRKGYWMPTETDDGGFFNFNDAGELPNIPRKGNNYYMEFVVWPSINLAGGTYTNKQDAYGVVTFPGPMRLLIGLGGEVWFTGDHYGEDGPQLNALNVNPPPPAGVFSVTSMVWQGTNTALTWNTIGGQTNIVQVAPNLGGAPGTFTNLSPNIIKPGGDLTNASYVDIGGATNFPARFYRISLLQ